MNKKRSRMDKTILILGGGIGGIVTAGVPYKCPPAPFEAAFVLESFLSRRGDGKVTIKIFTPEPAPLTAAGPSGTAMLTGLLKRRGIDLHVSHSIASVNGSLKKMSFENGGEHCQKRVFLRLPRRKPLRTI